MTEKKKDIASFTIKITSVEEVSEYIGFSMTYSYGFRSSPVAEMPGFMPLDFFQALAIRIVAHVYISKESYKKLSKKSKQTLAKLPIVIFDSADTKNAYPIKLTEIINKKR